MTNWKRLIISSGSDESLEWKKRFKVALGVAEGLNYLHNNSQRRIIHRDITASNILLTEDYQPQVSVFFLFHILWYYFCMWSEIESNISTYILCLVFVLFLGLLHSCQLQYCVYKVLPTINKLVSEDNKLISGCNNIYWYYLMLNLEYLMKALENMFFCIWANLWIRFALNVVYQLFWKNYRKL